MAYMGQDCVGPPVRNVKFPQFVGRALTSGTLVKAIPAIEAALCIFPGFCITGIAVSPGQVANTSSIAFRASPSVKSEAITET